ncbi:hypothetical protein KAR91_47325 [Candidatus Pacearchaeota archaeon]|nr:hypothetical protein [Candidatus Pacearchaeota archaeon]
MGGGLVESANPLSGFEEGSLGAGVGNNVGCVLESVIGVALLHQRLYLIETLGTGSVPDADSLQGSVDAVEQVAGDCSVGGIGGSTQSTKRQHQRSGGRSSSGAQPTDPRTARPSCNSGLGEVREVSRVGFCAKLGDESFDVVLSQLSVPDRCVIEVIV